MLIFVKNAMLIHLKLDFLAIPGRICCVLGFIDNYLLFFHTSDLHSVHFQQSWLRSSLLGDSLAFVCDILWVLLKY